MKRSTARSVQTIGVRILAGLSLAGLCLGLAASPVLQTSNAWTPEAPPGRMMAGFVTLHNPGNTTLTIVHVHSPQFGRVEIHDMVMTDDGVMRMRRMDRLEIRAGETIELRPGGKHLMLMQPQQRQQAGDELEIHLELDNGQQVSFVSIVRPRRP